MITTFTRVTERFGINSREAERFFKFAVVGAIGFIVDFGVFNLTLPFFYALLAVGQPLHEFFVGFGLTAEQVNLLGPTLAGMTSFVAAVVSNFLWNRYWTYPDSRSKSKRRQFVMFLVVSVIGITIRVPIITFLHTPLAEVFAVVPALAAYAEFLGNNVALAISVVVVMFWNFFANRYWTYNDIA